MVFFGIAANVQRIFLNSCLIIPHAEVAVPAASSFFFLLAKLRLFQPTQKDEGSKVSGNQVV